MFIPLTGFVKPYWLYEVDRVHRLCRSLVVVFLFFFGRKLFFARILSGNFSRGSSRREHFLRNCYCWRHSRENVVANVILGETLYGSAERPCWRHPRENTVLSRENVVVDVILVKILYDFAKTLYGSTKLLSDSVKTLYDSQAASSKPVSSLNFMGFFFSPLFNL